MKSNMKKGMFVALALSLLLVACDENLPGNKSGKEVLVQVRLVGIAEGGEENITRSASSKKQERFIAPAANGMLMEMQMEQDTSALRATKTQLAADSYFRVVAFKHETSTFISYGDFTIADGPVAGGLHVPINDSYDFVCYSYNTTTPLDALNYKQDATMPDTETISVLQGTKDLLWVKIEDKQVTDEAPELEILLSRVMARVKVAIDLSYNKWTITSISSGVTLGSVHSGGTVRLTDGTVEGTGTPTVTSWTGSGNQRESNELLVMPKASGSTITVNIPASAIARQNFASIPTVGATGTFIAELKPGYSYRLRMRWRSPIFARSNIYWDDITDPVNPTLTFIPAAEDPADNNDDYQGYQGVLFRWGSLVGISPVGNNSVSPKFDANLAVYVPVGTGTGASWTATGWVATTAGAKGWDIFRMCYTNQSALTNEIPYFDDMYAQVGNVTQDRNNTFVSDDAQNDPATHSGYRGDICLYLNGNYRLPTSNEFGTVGGFINWPSNPNGWQKGTGSFTNALDAGYPNGRADLLSDQQSNTFDPDNNTHAANTTVLGSAKNPALDNVVFPTSGIRNTTNNAGGLASVGASGQYWSGSAYRSASGYMWAFSGAYATSDNGSNSAGGFPVRCVKKVDPNGTY
jgi:hypothetical protein